MNNVIVDSCFWYALYDMSDTYHQQAQQIYQKLTDVRLIIPFPTLYEVINTRFSKSQNLTAFQNKILSPSCCLVSDNKYKNNALESTFDYSIQKKRPISLVDMIIRMMMEDVDLQIKGILTFNDKDFIDICRNKRIEIIYP